MRVSFGEYAFDGLGHVVIKMVKTHDDGTTENGVFIMPEDTLEWRAAEYGIDPGDVDTLMDVVLAEPFLASHPREIPVLFTAATVDEARVAHLQRCAQVKLEHRMSTRVAGHPLGELKTKMIMDPEALRLKRKIIRQRRAHVQREVVRRSRIDRLRDMIEAGGDDDA